MTIEDYEERFIDKKITLNEIFMGLSSEGLLNLKDFTLYHASRRDNRCILFLTPYHCEIMKKIEINAGSEENAQNLAKTYFEVLILNQLSKKYAQNMKYLSDASIEILNQLFDYGNISNITKNSRWSSTYREICNIKKKMGELEIDIFMTGMDNKYIQYEINSYLCKKDIRTRIWSDKDSFSTYLVPDRNKFLRSGVDFVNHSCDVPLEYSQVRTKS